MTCILLILKLFGGLILLFLFGRTIGHLFSLDEFYEDIHRYQNERIKRCENEYDQNYNN